MRANIDWVTHYSELTLATLKARGHDARVRAQRSWTAAEDAIRPVAAATVAWVRRASALAAAFTLAHGRDLRDRSRSYAIQAATAARIHGRTLFDQGRRSATLAATTIKARWRNPVFWRMLVGLLVAGLLLFAFSKLISLGAVWQRLEHLNFGIALLCGVVFLGAYVVRSMRWRLFVLPYKLTIRDAILIYQVSIFVNWLLPVRGGEVVKAWLARTRSDIPFSEALSTVAMDKLMDLLPSLVLLSILPFMPFHLAGGLWALLLFVAGVFMTVIVFLALCVWKRDLAMRLLGWFFALLPERIRTRVEPFAGSFVEALLRLVAQPRLMAAAMGITAVAVACDALFAWLAFLAIGTMVPVAVVLFGYTLYNLAYMLPTPPGQIGSNEVIGLAVFAGIFGVSRLSVASMFVFSHPWTALLMVVSGLVCASLLGVGVRTLFRLKPPPKAGDATGGPSPNGPSPNGPSSSDRPPSGLAA
ncbi:MAG TPA: lysylphosphatidylglycerol synthase transmembrane domain-containing protein [Ktedonobacterales bacterium]